MGRTSENFTCCLLVFCHLLLDTDAHWHGVPCGHTQKVRPGALRNRKLTALCLAVATDPSECNSKPQV